MSQDDPDFQYLQDKENEGTPNSDCTPGDESTPGSRWDKSLGVLCQKFVMLFLITPVSNNLLV